MSNHPESFRPVIAISTGDPAGIGPEVTLKALGDPELYHICKPLVIADLAIVKDILKRCGLELEARSVESPENGVYAFGTVDVLDMSNVDMKEHAFGKISATAGRASVEYVRKAIALTQSGHTDAMVTGPIHKEAIQLGGCDFAGHTEILAHETGVTRYAMMLADGNFRVVHVTTHLSLMEAIKQINKERVLEVILLANEALKRMGIDHPRIAVNGVNPHAGEHGLFGKEEMEHILPAIEEARHLGIQADGPHPADTVFPKMKGGAYDIVVCMYHDQGHIPVKLLGFHYDHQRQHWEGMSGVNITLGLPIVRVSVDHGTAFDKAGKCQSDPGSMKQAIEYAVRLSRT